MAKLNLLPWRQEKRDDEKKEYLVILAGFAVLALLVVFYLHNTFSQKIETQVRINNFLKAEIKKLDNKIAEIKNIREKKAALMAHMEVIQGLQQNRPAVVLLFDSMATVIPKGVNYNEVRRKDSIVTIEGNADSNTTVSQLMRNIANTQVLSEPTLSIIRAQDKKPGDLLTMRFFSLKAKQLNPFQQAETEDGE